MTDLQIKCFLMLSSTQSLTQVAEAMNYTPQAISKMLIALEKELGVRLFQRKNSRQDLVLTPAGQYYMDVFLKDNRKKNRILGEISGWYRWLSGHFRLGISEWLNPLGTEMVDALVAYQGKSANVVFSASAGDNHTLYTRLVDGELDAVIMPTNTLLSGTDIGITPIAREHPCLAVPEWICGPDADTIDPECWGATYVQRPYYDWGNAAFSKGTTRMLQKLGLYPRSVRMMPTVMSVNTALMISDCCTVSDRRFGNVSWLPHARYFDLPNAPESYLCCLWSYRNENPLLTDFIRFMQQYFGDDCPEWQQMMPPADEY